MGATERDAVPSRLELRTGVAEWLRAHAAELPPQDGADRSFSTRAALTRELQRALYDAGWVRYGWPASVGGFGGNILHRAVVYEELARAGYPDRGMLEHAEILLPPLVRHWTGPGPARAVPLYLRGDELWCQGFSEADAGSDLGSLRTRAVRDGSEYRVHGRKVWTSWAVQAERCVLLARTGSVQERSRGLTVFMVDLRAPGIDVSPIRQSNGQDELAEVTFDDVRVPELDRIGMEGDGWTIMLEILSYERGTSSWLRQALLGARADELAATQHPEPAHLGDVLLDIHALRLAVAEAMFEEAHGVVAGPKAALVKLLRTDAEQNLYDLVDRSLGGHLALGSTGPSALARWQEDYLFSRAVSIYGGTRQMQLNTVARHVLGIGVA